MNSQQDYSLPFKDINFCSTSVLSSLKADISFKIKAMGGSFFNDLVANVDFLIVGDTNTDKYRFCARNRYDVKFIKPDAIGLVHEKWLEGYGFDKGILDHYLMKPFDSLSVCLSRLPKSERNKVYQKNYLSALLKEFGASTTASLTSSNSLVVASQRSGRRYEKAIEWSIPIVHPKWILDSALRGALLDYKFYDITKLDEEDIGNDSCFVWSKIKDINDIYGFNLGIYNRHNQAKDDESETNINVLEASTFDRGSNNDILFSGMSFLLFGFNDEELKKLNGHIKKKGGEALLCADDEKSITHLLVSSKIPHKSLPNRFKKLINDNDLKVVNEWFIERSLFYGTVQLDNWSVPKNHYNLDFKLRISISGFSGIELLHLTKLIDLLGCQFVETFQDNCDLLVVNLSTIGLTPKNSPKLFSYKYSDILMTKLLPNISPEATKIKINAAKIWDIPIVSLAYLWYMSEEGVRPNILDYKWCIFCPRNSEPARNFMQYARGISDGTFQTQKKAVNSESSKETKSSRSADLSVHRKQAGDTETDQFEELNGKDNNNHSLAPSQHNNKVHHHYQSPDTLPAKIPSPKKVKPKVWPRLVGTAIESQLTSISFQPLTRKNVNVSTATRIVRATQRNTETPGLGTSTRKRPVERLEDCMGDISEQIGYDADPISNLGGKRARK